MLKFIQYSLLSLFLPLLLCLLSCSKKEPEDCFGHLINSNELSLLNKIERAKSSEEREKLITELEREPVKLHPFYSRWLNIHGGDIYAGWSDNGYDPSATPIPRDIQLLAAANYGVADIENGGLHQFFTNSTGVFGPEMVEWFQRAGFSEAANVLQEGIEKFGSNYPRSQKDRVEFLKKFKGETREEWDPFYDLDDRMFESLSSDGKNFDIIADQWLKEKCGVTNLRKSFK